jgi:hypothetical protein
MHPIYNLSWHGAANLYSEPNRALSMFTIYATVSMGNSGHLPWMYRNPKLMAISLYLHDDDYSASYLPWSIVSFFPPFSELGLNKLASVDGWCV